MNSKITHLISLSWVILVSTACGQNTTRYAPDNPHIQYTGRIDFSDPLNPQFAWSGVSIAAKFNGTGAAIRLIGHTGTSADPDYIGVFVDGAFTKKVRIDTAVQLTISLAEGLAPGIHTVMVIKRTEAWFGRIIFNGFEITGELLEPDPLPAPKIEFVGNSITCGLGNEGGPTEWQILSENENSDLAFGAVCARELRAEYRIAAWSGRGVSVNNNNFVAPLMPELYDRILPDDAASVYNHASWTPQVIVVNLGTNDMTGNVTEAGFRDDYVRFLETIRGYHSAAEIVCLLGPMNNSDILRSWIQNVVSLRTGAGDTRIRFFELTHQYAQAGYVGEVGHPTTLMADINGKELAQFIIAQNLISEVSVKGSAGAGAQNSKVRATAAFKPPSPRYRDGSGKDYNAGGQILF